MKAENNILNININIRQSGLILAICFFFITNCSYAQLGETCPPCDIEEGEVIFAQWTFEDAIEEARRTRDDAKAKETFLNRVRRYYRQVQQEAIRLCNANGASEECREALEKQAEVLEHLRQAQEDYEKALEANRKACEKVIKARDELTKAEEALQACIARGAQRSCLECSNGVVVANNDDDPGECLKCDNGEIVADNDEDPGDCLKCDNKQVVADNDEIPGPCLYCDNKVIKERCVAGEQCCDGICEEIIQAYRVTRTVRTCTNTSGSPLPGERNDEVSDLGVKESSKSFWSKTCIAITTGSLYDSKGRCTGSEISITCEGPKSMPCGAKLGFITDLDLQFVKNYLKKINSCNPKKFRGKDINTY